MLGDTSLLHYAAKLSGSKDLWTHQWSDRADTLAPDLPFAQPGKNRGCHAPCRASGSGLLLERQNWTVRTTMRRYTRLSNGFSRKLRNHAAATALNYFAYNFIKIHRTLRTSPAMAAGVTDRLWDVSDCSPLGSLRAAEGGKSGLGT